MKKVCFVCLGNICRSPMAEFVMKDLINQEDLTDIFVESRATSSWEHGNPIHHGTREIFKRYAIAYDKHKGSQQISRADMEEFDLILGMDEQNVSDLKAMFPSEGADKVHLFIDGGVPDPYYTGDFEETYELVKKGCQQWLQYIKRQDGMLND